MRAAFDAFAAAVLYGGLFGLAVLAVAVFCVGVAHVWRAMRFESANGSERDGAKALSPKSPAPTFFGKVVALLAVVLATLYGGSKTGRVTVDDPYILDNGSYVTNYYVHIAIAKRYDIVPDDTEILIFYREVASTNASDWVQYVNQSAPGYFTLADFPADLWQDHATNYNWLVAANYVQPPVVHTNGVWQIKGFVVPGTATNDTTGMLAFPNTKMKKAYDAGSYIQDGLVAMWDGVENAGWGVHDATVTTWVDLSGNGYDATQRVASSGWRWDEDAYVGTLKNGHGFCAPVEVSSAIRENINGHTIEIVFCPSDNSRQAIFGQYTDASGVSGGLNIEYSPHLAGSFRAYYGARPDVNTTAWKNGKVRMTCAVVCNGDNLLLYENGTHTVTAMQPGATYVGNANSFIIGGENARGNMSIFGELCAVRIYSRALTAEEIYHNQAIDKLRFTPK